MNPSRSRGRKRVWRVVINKLLTNRHRTDTLILKSPARYHPVDIPKAPGHFLSDANDRLPTATKEKKRDETQTVKRCHREKQKGTPRLHCHLRSKNPSRDILATRKPFSAVKMICHFYTTSLFLSLCVCHRKRVTEPFSMRETEREESPGWTISRYRRSASGQEKKERDKSVKSRRVNDTRRCRQCRVAYRITSSRG
jgi:hypothetical protein